MYDILKRMLCVNTERYVEQKMTYDGLLSKKMVQLAMSQASTWSAVSSPANRPGDLPQECPRAL